MTIAVFNYIESGLWFAIAVGVILKAWHLGWHSPYLGLSLRTAVTFVAFGVSDLIEAQTGAWWQPFSLLVFKAGCIVLFVVYFVQYQRIKIGN